MPGPGVGVEVGRATLARLAEARIPVDTCATLQSRVPASGSADDRQVDLQGRDADPRRDRGRPAMDAVADGTAPPSRAAAA